MALSSTVPPPLPKQHRRRGVVIALMLGGFLVVAVFFSPLGRGLSPVAGPNLRGAWTICKQFVGDKLTSPASATFPTFDEADVFDLAGGQVRALGHVDSQNRYGAMIRSTFNCTVTPLGGTRWRLDSLTLNER